MLFNLGFVLLFFLLLQILLNYSFGVIHDSVWCFRLTARLILITTYLQSLRRLSREIIQYSIYIGSQFVGWASTSCLPYNSVLLFSLAGFPLLGGRQPRLDPGLAVWLPWLKVLRLLFFLLGRRSLSKERKQNNIIIIIIIRSISTAAALRGFVTWTQLVYDPYHIFFFTYVSIRS